MTELNLEVGQKVWSIQLGECEVEGITDTHYMIKGKSHSFYYTFEGRFEESEFYPSLFLSNPFEKKSVQGNKDGWVEPKENKADLINALCRIRESFASGQILIDVETKLNKLLESI